MLTSVVVVESSLPLCGVDDLYVAFFLLGNLVPNWPRDGLACSLFFLCGTFPLPVVVGPLYFPPLLFVLVSILRPQAPPCYEMVECGRWLFFSFLFFD